MKAWFKTWFNSPYYHILYKNRSQEEADAFVKTCINHFQFKPNQTLLDVACGKGRHARAFAESGLDVTGIDLSEESILYARQFETEQLHFHIHDMRRTFRVNYYDIVTNMFTSFGYFKKSHEHQLAARSMAQALKPKGVYLMDFVNQEPVFDAVRSHQPETVLLDGITFLIQKELDGDQIIKRIQVIDGNRREEFTETLTSFSYDAMKQLFTQEGLHLMNQFGNYALSDYDRQLSPRMILLFSK